ncbi:MAG: aspartate aminotransferase [Verrucomicrobiales bacterium]|nr:aspartate aminotransferase [Verrucomicrobiales bacterium]
MTDLWKQANQQLRELVSYEPGKPIEEVARELGLNPDEIVKLASNENPLGPSPKAVAAMQEALLQAHVYPDGGGYKLRTAIAAKFGLEMGNIVLGNGSNEIIEFIGHAFLKPGDEVITAKHAFVVYKLMATLFGATTIEVDDPGFKHDLPAMAAAVTPKTKEIFVANPNNPTGTLCSQAEVDAFMAMVPEHVIVVFDEAYYEFLEEPLDTLKYVREGRNVVVMRTFSKIQGLASLRIGYGIAPQHLADILQKTRQPFNANAIAQAGALAGLMDEDHQDRTRAVNREGRLFLEKLFGELGLEFIPTHANFILVKVGDGDALFHHSMTKGVILRAMRAYGLPDWIRVSIGTMPQNEKFAGVLRGWLAAR